MATQHFFVDGIWLGSREIETMRLVPGLEIRPHYSYVYFCMRCGEIWGRVLHDRAKLTQAVSRACSSHGDGRLSCPDEWFDVPLRVEGDWPPAAIRNEFFASLNKLESESNYGN
jgi:hypothetical protein